MSVQISSGVPAPRLTRGGIELDGKLVPLLSGSVHYFRLEPESWRTCLISLREMGCTLVDVYVPWSAHEQSDGSLDFGERSPSLDVARFLRLAEEVGLYALVRPGPHINAELSGFGLPERVLWDQECQALSPAGRPVILPMPPLAFPVPSYASRKFLREACRWLRSVAAVLGPLTWPNGPVVMCQVDNEGALYFRDGVYEQDYHPDSLVLYQKLLAERYGSPSRLATAHAIAAVDFAVSPPVRFDPNEDGGLVRHLDWAEHQESLIAEAFATFREALSHDGLERAPTCHNLPMGESATPLDPSRLGKVVECLGMDYYHVAAEGSADAILKRTSEIVARADAFDYPAFAVELAAGFPPFFPALTERDNRFAALSCLAAGIRGYNLYMAVERDRWIGAPIDRFGGRRPFFDFWYRLSEALLRTRLFELSRAADVCVVVPRSLHRLERVLHAFGPISAAAFDIMGLSAYDACFEQGPHASSLFAAEKFSRHLLDALTRAGIAYRIAGNDTAHHAVPAAKLSFVVSAVGLEPELWQVLCDSHSRGANLHFGPELPRSTPNGTGALPLPPSGLSWLDERALRSELSTLCERAGVLRFDPGPGLRTSLFRDRDGAARVLFVTNTTHEPRLARLDLTALGLTSERAVDALDGDVFRATVGSLEVPLSPHSVRMLELGA